MLGKITKKTVDALPAGRAPVGPRPPRICGPSSGGRHRVYVVKYRTAGAAATLAHDWPRMAPVDARHGARGGAQVLAAVAAGTIPAGRASGPRPPPR